MLCSITYCWIRGTSVQYKLSTKWNIQKWVIKNKFVLKNILIVCMVHKITNKTITFWIGIIKSVCNNILNGGLMVKLKYLDRFT